MNEDMGIWVSQEVREALKALEREGEGVDVVIRRLIDARLVESEEEEMDAGELARVAIDSTRIILSAIMDDPVAIVEATIAGLNPEHIEDMIYDIMKYREKAAAKKPESGGGEGIHKILPGAEGIPEPVEEFSEVDFVEEAPTLEERVNRLEGTIEEIDAELGLLEEHLNLGREENELVGNVHYAKDEFNPGLWDMEAEGGGN